MWDPSEPQRSHEAKKREWSLMSLLSTALFCSVLIPNGIYGAIPQQPSTFKTNWDEAGNPLMLWTFRQTECLSGTIKEDRGVGPDFVRHSDSACPSNGTFTNAVVGATSTSTTARNTIKSGAVGTTFNSITTPTDTAPFRALSIVLWLTPTGENLVDGNKYMLLEIGQENGTTGAFSVAHNQLQIYIEASGGAEDDRLFAQVLLNPGTGSANAPLLRSCLNGTFIEPVGSGAATRYFLALTLSSIGGRFVIGSHVGAAGAMLNTCIGASGVLSSSTDDVPKAFGFQPDSVIRVGSSRTVSTTTFGLPATYHLVAFYDRALSDVEVGKLFAAGVPNSVPVLAGGEGQAIILGEDQTNPRIALNTLDVLDSDGNALSAIKVKTLPAPGQLLRNGSLVAINDTVLVTDNFTYVPPKDLFSIGDPTCDNFVSNVTSFRFTSFDFEATDGLGDGTVNCSSNNLSPACLSPRVGKMTICVQETNDPPVVITPTSAFLAFAGVPNPTAFQISCRDIDQTVGTFGLAKIRLTNQSQATLGKINLNGTCAGATFFNVSNPAAAETIVSPAQNVTATLTFCYDANPSTSNATLIGNDTISFVCEDKFGDTTAGVAIVSVYNGLLAGCGISREEVAAQKPCKSMMLEDVPINLTLRGNDSVASHVNSKRVYRLDTVPSASEGILTLPNSSVALTAGAVIHADLADGNLLLTFIPTQDYFNAICALNEDPTVPVCANPRFTDALDVNIVPQAGPLNFIFSLGYNETGTVIFGPSAFYFVTVLGVNDAPSAFTGPERIIMSVSTNYRVAETPPGYAYIDPDKDTMRIGFKIQTGDVQYQARFPQVNLSADGLFRITMLEGSNCLDNGASDGCTFSGKAYVTDLLTLLSKLTVITQRTSGNTTLNITIWDPAPDPGQFQPIFFDTLIPPNITCSSILQAKTNSTGSVQDNGLTVALWAGIGAGFLFILLACLACWGCLISRAKRGEEAAVWLIKNVLCSDVEHKHNPDLKKAAAGGRKSLEAAIHAEHARLARVVCCALFLRKVCPCIVKFDPTDLKIPDEETLLQTAINSEREKIAKKHTPKTAAPVADEPPMKLADDEEAVVSEDPLADDSIFDWERHVDEKTKKVFYYNVRTHESRWTPPNVKVLERRKSIDRMSRPHQLHAPHPPAEPKPAAHPDDSDADRVKKT